MEKITNFLRKKFFLPLLFSIISSASVFAVTITSNAVVGNWSATTSWVGGVVPVAGNTVVIAAGATITIDGNFTCAGVTINGTGILQCSTNQLFTVTGTFTNNGTYTCTSGTTKLTGATLNGSAGSTFYNLTVSPAAALLTATTVTAPITVSNNLVVSAGDVLKLSANSATVSGSVTNSGDIAVTTGTFTANGGVTNNAAGTISFTTGNFIEVGDVINNSNANGITFTSGSFTITGNLINGGTVSYTGAGSLKVTANFTNNGTFTAGGSTVTLNGNANQTIGGTTNPTTFNKLTYNPGALTDTVFLNIAITLASNFAISNGVFDCLANQITGTAGTMIMAAGTTLLLGSPTVATAVNFPTTYTTLNITLNAGSYVIYQANANQTISGTPKYANLTITSGSATTTNTLAANTTVTGNLLIQDGTGVVTLSASTFDITLGGNFTDNGIFNAGTGLVTFNGSAGVQAITSTEAAGLTFYDLTFNNSNAAAPGLTSTANLNVNDILTFTNGNLDMKGNTFSVTNTGAASITDNLSGGILYSSSTGAQFNVTDPDTVITLDLFGTWMGNQSIGVTINATAYDIEFENYTEYGTASFTKVGNVADQFTGGNGFHGPATFTATNSSQRWKFGVSTTLPDTFYNATFNANANRTGNDNFILGANNQEDFYGVTTITSTTPGGIYFGRSNGTGSANITFHGPVVATVSFTGSVYFADAAAAENNAVTFDSTITLNSTITSTGFYYFGDSKFSLVTLNSGGQFLTGSINGKTNVYLEEVTQNGSKTQTINTAGSTGKLFIGGTASAASSLPNSFSGPCNFTADTAGYIINAIFFANSTFTVNHAGASGYLISDEFLGTLMATVGDILFQNNIFNTTTTLHHTSSTSSTNNGGNVFNGTTTIINSGTATLETGTFAADAFSTDVTFTQNGGGACLIDVARTNASTFGGNITVNGTSTNQMTFGSNNGGIIIAGSGTEIFATGGSAVVPAINNLTMEMTAAGTNVLQFNLSPSFTLTGVLTFNAANTGLINLNGSAMTLGTASATPGTISYPAPPTVAGWIYGGTFSRWFAAGATIPLPTGASVSTTGFFPIGSSSVLNNFQPFWFAAPATTIKTANVLTLSQTSNANWYTPVSYVDATWSGGTTVQGVSVATWVVSPNASLALNVANDAEIMFGGFGFVTFVTADVNASLAAGTAGTYAAPSQFYGATDFEVERTGLSLLQLNNTWHIGTSNVTTSPLPITLVDFNAVYNPAENITNLTWSTASEVNNKSFTVERSIDQINFTEVATVAGAGNSSQTLNYATIDPNPVPGVDYYRLKQTNFDGSYTYSYVVEVNVTSSTQLTLFPNPVNSTLMLSYYVPETTNMEVSIVDVTGQQVATYSTTMQKGNSTFTADASSLASGVYFIKAIIGEQTFVKKFVKQ